MEKKYFTTNFNPHIQKFWPKELEKIPGFMAMNLREIFLKVTYVRTILDSLQFLAL